MELDSERPVFIRSTENHHVNDFSRVLQIYLASYPDNPQFFFKLTGTRESSFGYYLFLLYKTKLSDITFNCFKSSLALKFHIFHIYLNMIIRGFCVPVSEGKKMLYKIKILNNKITLKLLYETAYSHLEEKRYSQQEMIPEGFLLFLPVMWNRNSRSPLYLFCPIWWLLAIHEHLKCGWSELRCCKIHTRFWRLGKCKLSVLLFIFKINCVLKWYFGIYRFNKICYHCHYFLITFIRKVLKALPIVAVCTYLTVSPL